MSDALIEVAKLATVPLKPSPIEPSWIIEGNPVAQRCDVSRSVDGLATTIVWQCSEGKFNWYYELDETILILEGSIVLESATMPPTRYGPGDIIFFKNGAHAKWHVESPVRKIAFFRTTQPVILGLALRVMGRIKRAVFPLDKSQLRSWSGSISAVALLF